MATNTLVSMEVVWSPQYGNYTTNYKFQSIVDYPPVPDGNVLDPKFSVENGLFTTSYQVIGLGDSTGKVAAQPSSANYNYASRAVVSTEPLKTHWKFQPGQPLALSQDDLNNIEKIEVGQHRYQDFIGAGNSAGLIQYCQSMLSGEDSYYICTQALSITELEPEFPDQSAVGTIVTIPNAPTVASGVTWLLVGITADSNGSGSWRVTREYKASGRSGWNPTYYAST